MNTKATLTRFKLDPANPPTLTATEALLLAAAPVDCSDIPELPPEFWNAASTKTQVTLRLDRDVLEFFRNGGQRYQTRINAALRAFVEHQRKRA